MANLKERIDAVRKEFDEAARRAADAKSLEELRTAYLGRKRGHVTLLFEDLKSVPAEEKREAGRLVNELKDYRPGPIVELEGRVEARPEPPGRRRSRDPT